MSFWAGDLPGSTRSWGCHALGGASRALPAGSLIAHSCMLHWETQGGNVCWLRCVGAASRRKNDVADIHSEDGLFSQTLGNRRWLVIHEGIH